VTTRRGEFNVRLQVNSETRQCAVVSMGEVKP
jgi:hypothetical protein